MQNKMAKGNEKKDGLESFRGHGMRHHDKPRFEQVHLCRPIARNDNETIRAKMNEFRAEDKKESLEPITRFGFYQLLVHHLDGMRYSSHLQRALVELGFVQKPGAVSAEPMAEPLMAAAAQ